MTSSPDAIRVTARYFAAFREQAGCDVESLTTRSTTAAELYAEVSARHSFRDAADRCKVAINGTMSAWNEQLSQDDEVLFFPPVAGG